MYFLLCTKNDTKWNYIKLCPFLLLFNFPSFCSLDRQTIFSVTLLCTYIHIKWFKFMDITLHTLSDFKQSILSCISNVNISFYIRNSGGTLIFNIKSLQCVCLYQKTTRGTDIKWNGMTCISHFKICIHDMMPIFMAKLYQNTMNYCQC